MSLSIVEKAASLREASLLRDLKPEDLLQLAAVAEEQSFAADDFLFHEGEEGEYMYVLLDGRVRLERAGHEFGTVGPGEATGEFAVLDRRPRSASAEVLEPTTVLAIHRDDFAQVLEDNYGLVESLFENLIGIIRTMNEEIIQRGDSPEEERAGSREDR